MTLDWLASRHDAIECERCGADRGVGDGDFVGALKAFLHNPGCIHGPPWKERSTDREYWVIQLDTWHQDGTFVRLQAAMDAKQPVHVRRSDGSLSVGTLHSIANFGGREVEVELHLPDGPHYKCMPTEDFLALNPGFGPHLLELRLDAAEASRG